MTDPRPPVSGEPSTEAGRTLYNVAEHMEWTNGFPVSNRYMLDAILAIEAQAAMNGWNMHVEAIGEPDRAAFMEGYNARRDEEAEATPGAAAPPPLDAKTLARAMAEWSDPDGSADELERSAAFYEQSAQETLDIVARLRAEIEKP